MIPNSRKCLLALCVLAVASVSLARFGKFFADSAIELRMTT